MVIGYWLLVIGWPGVGYSGGEMKRAAAPNEEGRQTSGALPQSTQDSQPGSFVADLEIRLAGFELEHEAIA